MVLLFFCSDIFDWFTFGKMIQSDRYFSNGLKTQLSNGKLVVWISWITENEKECHLGKYPIRIPKPPGPRFGALNHQVLVASHNRHSIERTIQKMAELGVSQVGVDGRIGAPKRLFVLGDLLGMRSGTLLY